MAADGWYNHFIFHGTFARGRNYSRAHTKYIIYILYILYIDTHTHTDLLMGGVCAVVERAGLTTDDEGSVDYRYIYLRCIIYSYKGSGTTAVILPLCPPKLYRRRRAAVSICPSAIESHAREGACARKTPPSQTATLDTAVNFDSAGDRGGDTYENFTEPTCNFWSVVFRWDPIT